MIKNYIIPKTILVFVLFLNGHLFSFSQAPESFNYQTIIKNAQGEAIANQEIAMQISILEASPSGTSVYTETHQPETNSFGLVNLLIGEGEVVLGDFETIAWGEDSYFIKIEMDITGGAAYTEIGTMPLLSVPYALYAKNVQNKDDADADPANEIQTLSIADDQLAISDGNTVTLPGEDETNELQTIEISGDQLSISDGNTVALPDADTANELQTIQLDADQLSISKGNSISLGDFVSPWQPENENIYYNGGNVGIGKNQPSSKLEVKGDSTSNDTDPLFQVINKYGDTVFAVFPDGVVIYINDSTTKGSIGGFAVSGRTVTKEGTNDYLRITADSTRIYINDAAKGNIGGFAVSGRTVTKGSSNEFLRVTPDSTRVYVKKSTKGNIGGFAVSGRTVTKGIEEPMFLSTFDSTRVYIDSSSSKGNIGGFAVSGRTVTKGQTYNFMNLTPNNYFIGHRSGESITTGLYNVFLGYEAGKNTDGGVVSHYGSSNVFLGYQSGLNNQRGFDNIFIGNSSGKSNTTGSQNIFMGTNTGISNVGGYENIFIGNMAGEANDDGIHNVYIGNDAGKDNITGQSNVAIGHAAAMSNTNLQNVFIGMSSGMANVDGMQNTFVGALSGQVNDGSGNVIVGIASGRYSSGSNNVYLGKFAGYSSQGSGNVFIGVNAGYDIDRSNRLFITNSNVDSTQALIYGEFDNHYLRFNATTHINDVLILQPTTAPSNPIEGTIYMDAEHKIKVYNGTEWKTIQFEP